MDVAEPKTDLRPEYRKLIEETKRSPDAVYLLGRLENGREAEKLYMEAATGRPQCADAGGSLSFRYLARGEFDSAVQWAKKARELAPLDPTFRVRLIDALMAAGQYAELLKVSASTGLTDRGQFLRYRLAAHIAAGEPGAAEGEINRLAALPGLVALTPAQNQMVAQNKLELELVLAEVRGDRAKYLELAGRLGSRDVFITGLLRGDYKNAAAANSARPKSVGLARDWENDATRTGLLYLAGLKAKDAAFADEQRKRLVESLAKGDREGRFFAAIIDGKKPIDLPSVKDAAMDPSVKRIVVVALARMHPDRAKELHALAKKLDFQRDEYSLCLHYLME